MAEFETKFISGVLSSPIGSPGGTVLNDAKLRKENYAPSEGFRTGTWNVRSMLQAGKVHNTIREMERLKIDILGISEMRWPGSGECNIGDYTVYYIGSEESHNRYGVGLIMNKRVRSTVISCIPHSERVILLKLRGKPTNINLIQVYAPTAESSENEVEEFYHQIKTVLRYTKKQEVTLIVGDFNAKVGQGQDDNIVGSFGLGKRNERGDRLVQFCREEQLLITNTCFKLPPRRLYTWKAPGDTKEKIIRNQIDYILVDQRCFN